MAAVVNHCTLVFVNYSCDQGCFIKHNELIQYRNPPGAGPSGNIWPKCASQTLHCTSTRTIPHEPSLMYLMALSFTGCVKLGQPVPELNFSVLSKRRILQHTQKYLPGSWLLQCSPEKGDSVPCSLVIWNWFLFKTFFHCSLVLSSLRSGVGFSLEVKSKILSQVSILLFCTKIFPRLQIQ